MEKPFYVRFNFPPEIIQQVYNVLSVAKKTGKIKIGVERVTKAVEDKKAKLVYIPEDIYPPEIVAHLPSLCDDMKIPYVYVPDKSTLGMYCGTKKTDSACITDLGKAYELYDKLVREIIKISKQKLD